MPLLGRLLDLTTFFLHRTARQAARAASGRCCSSCTQSDTLLAGKKVLIVDDDMRNIFALSTVLEQHDMVIVSADNGRDAIRTAAGRSRTSTSCSWTS